MQASKSCTKRGILEEQLMVLSGKIRVYVKVSMASFVGNCWYTIGALLVDVLQSVECIIHLCHKNAKSCFWFCSLAIIVEKLVVDAGLRMIKWTVLPSPRASTGMRNGRKRSNTRFAIWSGPSTGWLATPRFNLYHRRHQWPSPPDNNKAAPLPRTQTRSLWKQPLPIHQRQSHLITSSCVFKQPRDLILFLCSSRQALTGTYIYGCHGHSLSAWSLNANIATTISAKSCKRAIYTFFY